MVINDVVMSPKEGLLQLLTKYEQELRQIARTIEASEKGFTSACAELDSIQARRDGRQEAMSIPKTALRGVSPRRLIVAHVPQAAVIPTSSTFTRQMRRLKMWLTWSSAG